MLTSVQYLFNIFFTIFPTWLKHAYPLRAAAAYVFTTPLSPSRAEAEPVPQSSLAPMGAADGAYRESHGLADTSHRGVEGTGAAASSRCICWR